MLASLKRNLFPFLIAFSALSVSASAAFYSVTGLSKLFAGASFEVIIMAASLEIAKLVIASLLYQYWDTLNKWLRTYLTIAATVLVLITSMGIYGFLSAAYQETYSKLVVNQNQIEFLENKAQFYQDDIDRYDEELAIISTNINTLSNARASSIQVRDTTSSTGFRQTISTTELRLAQKRIEQEEANRRLVNEKRTVAADSLQTYKLQILELQNASDTVGELGPLQYLSGLTGTPMDKIINWLLLVIIFVFDPLAISLVVAANFAFDKVNPKRKEDEPLPSRSIWDDLDEELDESAEIFMNDILPDDDFDTWDDDGGLEDEEEPIEYAEDILDKPHANPRSTTSDYVINQDELEAWTKIADELAEGSQLLDEDELLEDEFGHLVEDEEEWDEEHALDQVLNDMVEQLDEEDLKELEVEAEEVSNKFEVENTQGDVTVIEEDQSDQTEMETDRVGTFPNQVNPTSVGSIVQKLDTPHLPENQQPEKIYKRPVEETTPEPSIEAPVTKETPEITDEERFNQALREQAEKDKQEFLRKNGR